MGYIPKNRIERFPFTRTQFKSRDEVQEQRIKRNLCPLCGRNTEKNEEFVKCTNTFCKFVTPLENWHPEIGYCVTEKIY